MKKNVMLIIAGLFFAIVPAIYAQVIEEWVARYDFQANDDGLSVDIALDDSGNIYVTGQSVGSETSADYATVKYNSSGIQQWVARYNGPASGVDRAMAIALDGSGNVYVTGYSEGSGTDHDCATIKYNSSGVQQWVTRYDGPANGVDRALAIALDGSGNIYITGFRQGSGTNYDYVTIKYNSSGVQQWVASYDGPVSGGDNACDIALDGLGNVYVTGWSDGSGTNHDYATIMYNSSGVQRWIARYDGPTNGVDATSAIALDGSGNVYVTGYSNGSGTDHDYATIKYNSSGVEQWIARYDGPASGTDLANAIALDGSGNVYVTGFSTGSGTSTDYATIKYNPSGVQQWVARYSGPASGADRGQDIALGGSGNIYITGFSLGSGTKSDYATVKYNPSGVQQWVARYDGPASAGDMATAIALDGSDNVYVTGLSKGSGTNEDYATIKYIQLESLAPMVQISCDFGGVYWSEYNQSHTIMIIDILWHDPFWWLKHPDEVIDPWELEVQLGYIFFHDEAGAENSYVFNATLDLRYKILAGKQVSPFIGTGPGYYRLGYANANEFGVNGCTGIDFNLTQRLSLEACGTVHYLFDRGNTWFPQATIGLLYGF